MRSLTHRNILVTGGSRGLGLGLVEALVARDARVTVVARDAQALKAVRDRLGVATVAADVADAEAARRLVGEIAPEVLVLNAGATPPMDRIDRISWADFAATWESDVRAGLFWVQAALTRPLAPGARVLLGSSGAAINGSPLSGGYAGAKRMLWVMAKYANALSQQQGLGIRFQAIVPLQMVAGTGVGEAGAAGYAKASGITSAAFLARFPAMTPRQFGEQVATLLEDPSHDDEVAFGIKGDAPMAVLEGAAA